MQPTNRNHPQPLTVRRAAIADAEALHELHVRSVRELCSPFYDESVINGWLAGRSASIYLAVIAAGSMDIAESDGKILGFAEAVPGEIRAVYVAPEYARCGVGSRLLAQALGRASKECDSVRLKSSLNAVAFYERFGFVQVSQSTFRRNDVDIPVVLMEKKVETARSPSPTPA